ncbi:MAG TPA: D-alanine--D-alanine ligase, partial [bacterium]|nr:D-alanine--D-alanine ligase [bacterium]
MAKKGINKIAVLAGGDSPEREVSLRSGAAVARALESRGFETVTLDPAAPGFAGALLAGGPPRAAFVALHGGSGENGTIQGFLETLGIPYTGSGVLASALAMDKLLSKQIFLASGVPVPPPCGPGELPLVVKPACGGSTLGISIVRTPGQLAAARRLALRYDRRLLMERFIPGVEITVSILGNRRPRILPSIEIVPVGSDFYDYRAKYQSGGSRHIIPPRLPEAFRRRAERAALRAHQVLGCRGLSRSEVIVDREGRPYLLDVNTIPGFTETSLFPDAAAAAG